MKKLFRWEWEYLYIFCVLGLLVGLLYFNPAWLNTAKGQIGGSSTITGTPTIVGDITSSGTITGDYITGKFIEISVSASLTLTVAQCSGTVVTSYSPGAAMVITLPAAESGLNCLVAVGGTAGYTLDVDTNASDKAYLDGTALDDGDKVRSTAANTATGDFISFWTFKNGASSWDWMARSQEGTWIDGGP